MIALAHTAPASGTSCAQVLRVTIRFDGLGCHAQDLTGRAVWPLPPGTVFAALVAGSAAANDGTPSPLLAALETCPVAVWASDARRTAVARWAPQGTLTVNETQLGPPLARVDGTVDLSTLLSPIVEASACPDVPVAAYDWPVDDPAVLAAVQAAAWRVGHAGRAQSKVTVTAGLADPTDQPVDGLDRWVPSRSGEEVHVPAPGQLDRLIARHRDRHAGGPLAGWAPPTDGWDTVRLAHDRMGVGAEGPWERPTVFSLSRPVDPRRALTIAEQVRRRYVDMLDGRSDRLAGHSGDGHPAFLPLPWVAGGRHSDGLLRGVLVCPPRGLDEVDRAAHRDAVRWLDGLQLAVPGKPVELTSASQTVTASAWRWQRPSTVWGSVTPAVVDFYPRGRRNGGHDALVREAEASVRRSTGLDPIEVEVSRVPTLRGAELRWSHDELVRPGKRSGPVVWLTVRFASPVLGPLAIGRSRHFGVGLLTPLDPLAGKGTGQ